jgi:hypothetical protein
VEIDPPRNNRLQLIETVSSRGRSNHTPRPRPINILTGLKDCPCLRKLMHQAAAQPPPCSYLSFIPQLVPDPATPAQSARVLLIELLHKRNRLGTRLTHKFCCRPILLYGHERYYRRHRHGTCPAREDSELTRSEPDNRQTWSEFRIANEKGNKISTEPRCPRKDRRGAT